MRRCSSSIASEENSITCAALDVDQMVVMLLVGMLVARDAVLEGVALDRALGLQQLHRAVDGRERQRRVMREGAGENALGVGMVVGFGQNAQDQPALLRHAQAGIPELALEDGHALIDSRHAVRHSKAARHLQKPALSQIVRKSVDRCNWFAIA